MSYQKNPIIPRPPGVTDDHEQIALVTSQGKTIIVWGKVSRRILPDGSEEITVEDAIFVE